MNCPNCGRKIADTMPICPFCGHKIGLMEAGSEQMHSSAAKLFNRQTNDKKAEEKKEEKQDAVQNKTVEAKSSKGTETKVVYSPTLKVDELKKQEEVKPPVAEVTEEKTTPSVTDKDTDAPVTEQEELAENTVSNDNDMSDEINNDYNPNADGYYDDVVPAMAEQINKLPVENMMRIGIVVVTLIVIGLILFIGK